MSSQLKPFNVKSGLSVGDQFYDVVDSNGNASFNTLSVVGDSELTGNLSAPIITATSFVVYPSYTAVDLRLITGAIGWTAAVSDSAPGGKHAYWDDTNGRWAYVSDDSAV